MPVGQDRVDPLWRKPHRVTASGRETFLGEQLTDPHEHQISRLDADYVQNWSLAQDFKILFRTIPAVLGRVGAR